MRIKTPCAPRASLQPLSSDSEYSCKAHMGGTQPLPVLSVCGGPFDVTKAKCQFPPNRHVRLTPAIFPNFTCSHVLPPVSPFPSCCCSTPCQVGLSHSSSACLHSLVHFARCPCWHLKRTLFMRTSTSAMPNVAHQTSRILDVTNHPPPPPSDNPTWK